MSARDDDLWAGIHGTATELRLWLGQLGAALPPGLVEAWDQVTINQGIYWAEAQGVTPEYGISRTDCPEVLEDALDAEGFWSDGGEG